MPQTLKGYKALASYLGVGLESARKLMMREGFPVIEISPRVRLIDIATLKEWLEN
ncbi:MAG: DNA-binding protein [Oscillospiraceae bacterium]|jgi:hypothetical protein|nr:DNA-binding protein [Oscillospiraceae bacterium]